MKSSRYTAILCTVTLAALMISARAERAINPAEFRDPPKSFAIGTWWHWLNGNISKDGITKDLEAMAEQNIAHVTLFDAAPAPGGPVPIMKPAWFDMVSHAAAEANRIGLKLSMHPCPGWSELGGPWIPVEHSMKRLVWSQTLLAGGKNNGVVLAPLPQNMNWSKDIGVFAWPTTTPPTRMNGCIAAVSNGDAVKDGVLWDGNPGTGSLYKKDEYKWTLSFDFAQMHKADSLRLQIRWLSSPPSKNVRVVISGDGSPLVDTEVKGSELASALVVPFPLASAKTYSVEVTLPRSIQPWTTFRFMQITEAELLEGRELPQWNPGMQNLAQQLGDASGSGMPAWTEAASQPLDQAKIINLSANVKDGKLTWDAPAGNWRIVRFGFTTTGATNSQAREGGRGLESDKMSAEATEFGFRSYVDKVLDAAGSNRSAFDKILGDSWECGMQNWTDDFAAAFEKRRGYSLLPYLAVVAGETVGSKDETECFLNDFRRTISDLVLERFYGKMTELSHARGLRYAAEIGGSGPKVDIFAVARIIDEPMREFWSDNQDGSLPGIPDPILTNAVPDAAWLAGKPLVGAEAFTSWSADFQRTPGDYLYVAGVEFSKGFNNLYLHSFVHQPAEKSPGFTLGRHGQAFHRLNTWWPMIGDWLTSLQRNQYLLQGSTAVYDVLVYCGDAGAAFSEPPEVSGLPRGARRLRIDHQTLMNRVAMKDGKLTLDGKGDYVAILFPSGDLFAETVEKMQSLAVEGAVLGVTFPLRNPSWSDHQAQDRRLAAAAKALLGDVEHPVLPRDVGKGRVHALSDKKAIFRSFHPDFEGKPKGQGRPLLSYRKTLGDADIHLLVNANAVDMAFACRVANSNGRVPELWDPATGSVRSLPGALHEDGQACFDIQMEAKSSLFLVFREKNATVPPLPLLGTPREVVLSAAWTVTFLGLPDQAPIRMETLRSWTENDNSAIRSYSGIAMYQASAIVPPGSLEGAREVRLELGSVGKVARVTINGKRAGTLWRSPWSIDVTGLIREGENTLSVEVANSWLNKMLEDLSLPPAERKTWTTWDTKYWVDKNVVAEASGLLAAPKLLVFPELPQSSDCK